MVGYSLYCDQLDLLTPLVEHVANKHVSLGVTREQYPVVGNILLAALEVSWDDVTVVYNSDPIGGSWKGCVQ